MLDQIAAALGSLKTMSEIGSGLLAAKTLDEVRERTMDLQTRFLDIQQSLIATQLQMAAMQDENIKLRRELASAQGRATILDRYELMKFPETGAIAYQLKAQERQAGEPPHYICPNCYEKGTRVILQENGRMLYCGGCNLSVATRRPPPPNNRRMVSGGF